MGKYNTSKKTKSIKRVLVCIIYHNQEIDLELLLKRIKLNKNDRFLIIFDNINNLSLIKRLKKKYKNINLYFGKRRKKKVPYYRNIALNIAKKNYEILLYLDSDIYPEKRIVEKHFIKHNKYKNIPVIGGSVIASFIVKQKSFWEKLDGCMSWFTSFKPIKDKKVIFPYHLPTCNFSIKVNLLEKTNIKFNSNLITGEDVDFCNKIRNFGFDLLLVRGAEVIHNDRIFFRSFLNHQKSWGKHHYYIRYKNNKFFKNKKILFYFLFLFFYPFSIPIISLIAAYLNIKPLVKYKFNLISLSFAIYFTYIYKSFFTYFELFFDLKTKKLFK